MQPSSNFGSAPSTSFSCPIAFAFSSQRRKSKTPVALAPSEWVALGISFPGSGDFGVSTVAMTSFSFLISVCLLTRLLGVTSRNGNLHTLPSTFWPAAEYEWKYSAEKIQTLGEAGIIGKTKYMAWQKRAKGKTHLGAWQCAH